MKRVLAIILCFIFIGIGSAFAQNENIKGVQFKDGSIVYGRVIKVSVTDVQIEMKDGSIMSRKLEDVETFIKEGDEESLKILSNARHTWAIGTEISYIQYEEPGVMEETGMMYGIVGSYAYRNYVMLKVEGKLASGLLDYDGQLNDGTPLTINDIPNYMLEVRGVLGYDFAAKAITITPYLGIGYRWLQDNSQEQSVYGYKRESSRVYLPLGLEVVAKLGNGWSLGATGEYDVFLWGKQKSYWSDLDPGFNDPEKKQTKGYGYRGSISIAKKGERVGFTIEPYVKYWDMEESESADITYYGDYTGWYLVEPKNNSTEIGCKLAITF